MCLQTETTRSVAANQLLKRQFSARQVPLCRCLFFPHGERIQSSENEQGSGLLQTHAAATDLHGDENYKTLTFTVRGLTVPRVSRRMLEMGRRGLVLRSN